MLVGSWSSILLSPGPSETRILALTDKACPLSHKGGPHTPSWPHLLSRPPVLLASLYLEPPPLRPF